jgi:hypothetical protein
MMRSIFIALTMALVLALGVLEVLASRTPAAEYPANSPDAYALWHAR